jgi:hypothetical protein
LARKNVVYGWKAFDAVSLASSQTSAETEVGGEDYGSIYLFWTGSSPVGTITIEAKNGGGGTYRALDFGSAISISGASGNHEIILNEMPFTHLRIVYTRSSGSGSLTANVTFKSKGA